jgi:SAM-dependent methyltransferase
MDSKKIHEINGIAWDEAAAQYEKEIEQDIAFIQSGGKNLEPAELAILHDLRAWCGRAIHLQCAGGRDTLSLWNHGAASVVGVDISRRMIDCARRKSVALQAPAEWYAQDILDTPSSLDGTADLVYTGRGALIWMMDLDAWAAVVKRLLKPGGRVYIFEQHPISVLWRGDTDYYQLEEGWLGDYFDKRLYECQGFAKEYIDGEYLPDQPAAKYSRLWTIGDVVTALASAGLRLEKLLEHPDDPYPRANKIPKEILTKLPQSFSLLMINK